MSDRKEGWYWVHKTGAWVPAYFYCNTWVIGDVTYPGDTFSITKVGPRIPAPDEMEGWQLVPKRANDSMKLEGWKVKDNLGDSMHQAWNAMLQAAPKPGDV